MTMHARIEEKFRTITAPIAEAFSSNSSILALTFSGSITGGISDAFSDIDLIVYSRGKVDVGWRREIASRFSVRAEIDQQFYDESDDWLLADTNQRIELIYRSPEWLEEQIERVWLQGNASVGYSTCLIHSVKNSIILYDRENWFRQEQAKTASPYPDRLRTNIINKNLPMLSGKLNSSFDEQIRTAIRRNDIISINHRISAFIASYFDVLFALNRLTHFGEKKLVQHACAHCAILPPSFPHSIESLCTCSHADVPDVLALLVAEIRQLVQDNP